MGIELSSFKSQSEISNQWLTVNGDDMSKIVASGEKREINVAESTNVSKLKAAVKPEDLNRAANNVYLRGQLLEGLRSSLTGVGKDAVEKFMQEAETALFGELQDGQFGLTEGSQDLSTDTVRSLIDEANRLKAEVGQGGKPPVSNRGNRFDYDGNHNVININNVNNKDDEHFVDFGDDSSFTQNNVREDGLHLPDEHMSERNPVDYEEEPIVIRSNKPKIGAGGQKTQLADWVLYDAPDEHKRNQMLIKNSCPSATEAQRDAFQSMDIPFNYSDGYKRNCRKLGECLGLDASALVGARFSGVKPAGNGRDLVCTLSLSGGAGNIEVLMTPDGEFVNNADYQECYRYMKESADKFAATDLKAVNRVARFCNQLENLTNGSQFANALKSMLPGALAKVRQTVPSGDVSLAVWWNALGFEGDVPVDDPENGKSLAQFRFALKQRTEADFSLATGRDQAFGDPAYANLLKSDTYFAELFKLKYPNVKHKPSEAQAAALLRLDGRRMAELLGVNESEVQDPKVNEVKASELGRFIECKVTRPGGKFDQILIDQDGSVVLKSKGYEELRDLLYNLAVPELVEAFRTEDMPAAAHFCKMFFQAADSFNNEVDGYTDRSSDGRGPSWGVTGSTEVKGLMVNLLLSSLPSVVNKHPGVAPQDLYADIWKELRLAGKAPRGGDPLAGRKFLDAVRKRFADDVVEVMGFKGDMKEVVRKMLLPNTEKEFLAARNEFGDKQSFGQFIQCLMSSDGLSFDNRLRLHRGLFLPKMKDLSTKTMRANVKMEFAQGDTTGESLLYSGKTALVFQYDGRQDGTQYNLDGKHFWTIRKNRPEEKRDPGNAIETLRNAQFSPQQIFQLGKYLNNYAMNLASSMGVYSVQSGCEISIRSDKRPESVGDMFVSARMPVVRFHKLERVGKEKKIAMFVDKTNEFIVQDFVIHKDGTMTMKDLNVSSPAHIVHDYGNLKDVLNG